MRCREFLVTMARRYQVVVRGNGSCRTVSTPITVQSWLIGMARCWPVTTRPTCSTLTFPTGIHTANPPRSHRDALPPVVDVPGLCKVGLSICYDVRSELYRHLVGAGAELLMIPAAFTAFTGKDHWQVLQARAIENTAYVLAPAQTGLHDERQTHGQPL